MVNVSFFYFFFSYGGIKKLKVCFVLWYDLNFNVFIIEVVTDYVQSFFPVDVV